MSLRRIVLIAAGLLIGACALLFLMRGFGGAAPGTDPAASEETGPGAAGGKAGSKAPPPWQSFIRPDGKDTPARPAVRFAAGLPSPFDRLPAAAGGGARTETVAAGGPGLRVEGISFGTNAVALVSGQAVRVGDTISGHRVVRIDRSAVTLAGPRGGRVELGFRKERPADGGGR